MLRRSVTTFTILVAVMGLAACQGQPEPLPLADVPTKAPTAGAQTEAAPAEKTALECDFAGTGATISIDDKRLNFTCPPGFENSVGLFGDIQLTDNGWTIEKVAYAGEGTEVTAQTTQPVLITHIILDDGVDCAFAGTGATTGIDAGRLNFTCGENGDYTIGLFGDVIPGDKGWEITKGEVKLAADGPVSQNVATALIAKLVVEPE